MNHQGSVDIRVSNVSKSFRIDGRDLPVLNDISLDMPPGSFTSIVGQSGCGKSTLLRIIAGIEAPSAGEVTLNGVPVTGPSLTVGVLFQDSRLLPWLSVHRNIDFGLPRHVGKKERRELVGHYLRLVGLSGFENALPEQLSGGMRQRVSIARTLINDPHVLVLDEPFGALDAFTKVTLQNEVKDLCQRAGVTTVLVTHDIEEAVYLGDQVVIMGPKPSTIRRIVRVELPTERDRTGAEFSEYRRQISREFFSTGLQLT